MIARVAAWVEMGALVADGLATSVGLRCTDVVVAKNAFEQGALLSLVHVPRIQKFKQSKMKWSTLSIIPQGQSAYFTLMSGIRVLRRGDVRSKIALLVIRTRWVVSSDSQHLLAGNSEPTQT